MLSQSHYLRNTNSENYLRIHKGDSDTPSETLSVTWSQQTSVNLINLCTSNWAGLMETNEDIYSNLSFTD